MFTSDTSDHFLDDDGLTDTCTTEESNLTTADKRAEQVDDLNACFEDFCFGVEFNKLRRRLVNRTRILGINRAKLVDRFTQKVEHATEHAFADGHGDRSAGVGHFHATLHTVC